MEPRWYYGLKGQQHGPVTDQELDRLRQSGQLPESTLIWEKGMADWLPLSQILPSLPAAPIAAPTPPPSDGSPYAPPASGLTVGPVPYNGPPNNGLAIASLVCGILGFLCGGIFVAVPAIIMGHIARSQIAREPTRYRGAGMALAGLILGYVCVVINIAMIVFMVSGGFFKNL